MADIRIEGLTKRYGDVAAVDDVSLDIRGGEFFTLLGPSGCGKSTLLSMIAGLVEPDGGRLSISDRVVSDKAKRVFVMPEKRDCGLVFQSYALWPHMNVYDNLRYGLKLKKVPRDQQRERIQNALELVGLERLAERYPHELSGGQQQRAALARTIVAEPKVLLLDEPLSNLDAKLRTQARIWLREIHEETRLTTVYVTHDQEEALSLSNRIAVMDRGTVQQVDAPETLYQKPASKLVAEFIGTTHFVDGTVTHSNGRQLTIGLDGEAQGDAPGPELSTEVTDSQRQPGDRVTIALRPEQLEILDTDVATGHADLPCRVLSVAYLGGRYLYRLAAGANELEVHSARRIDKQKCVIRIATEDLPVFDLTVG
ncbi:ABC transporter ATP-binding protein [Mycolicibacterium hippocampi]|uniref:Trehalose import ATP-binding protein SugC n=1 Tax=Mycolicibacterium hippocampi TaxID=659824 RepID=A0A850PKM6_9MYCO|nr:ABC transporter ATP-binding protein [Mycolicibacterium hippocampi]NVN49287.1 ABC transporter ATP-binding protein [Mycolicibacterium hippocampi]